MVAIWLVLLIVELVLYYVKPPLAVPPVLKQVLDIVFIVVTVLLVLLLLGIHI